MLQLTREQPPGYGGVERVAHEVADAIAVHGLTPTSQVYFFFGSSDPDCPTTIWLRGALHL